MGSMALGRGMVEWTRLQGSFFAGTFMFIWHV
jgi:hypothetical protein